MSTLRNTVLVDVEGVEHVARSVGSLAGIAGGVPVASSGGVGVCSAERGVEGTWEELGSEPVRTTINSLVGAVGRSGVGGDGRRSGDVDLAVSVGASDDNVKVLAPVTSVGGGSVVNVRSPQSALVVGDGGWVRAPVTPDSGGSAVVLARVLRWITLDVDVERSAGRGVVTKRGASGGVVRGEGSKSEVGVGRSGGVEVVKGASIAEGSQRTDSLGLERTIVVEVGHGLIRGTISVWLRRAWILRVDETTVGTSLWGSWAGTSGATGRGRRTLRGRRGGRSQGDRRKV